LRFKKLTTLLLSCALLTGVVTTAAAMNGTRNISVTFRNITIAVNGKVVPVEQEPFIYEGRTYVPLRAISEILGEDVSWDEANNQVRINDRVRLLEYSAGRIEESFVKGMLSAAVDGVLSNSSDKEVTSAAVKCTVTSSTGTKYDILNTLEGSVPPHSVTSFTVRYGFYSLDTKAEAGLPSTCELLDVVYASN